MIETERLVIRPWKDGDIAHYKAMAIDVGYNCFAPPGIFLVRDDADATQRISVRIKLFDETRIGKFPVFEKQGGAFVGTCGGDFFPHPDDGRQEVELGYRFMLGAWGKGYATEAARSVTEYLLDDVGFKKIYAFAAPQNRQSLKVLEKIGFDYVNEMTWSGLPHRLYRRAKI